MNNSTHDFLTVDMRGLKAALVAHAQAERVSVPVQVQVLVRGAVARDLGLGMACEPQREDMSGLGTSLGSQ